MDPERSARLGRWIGPFVAGIAALAALAAPTKAGAIPAFARRYDTGCGTCHAVRFPVLNAYGEAFRDGGYRLPDGPQQAAEARHDVPVRSVQELHLPDSVPLSFRGETFGVVSPLDDDANPFDVSIYSILSGGASLGKNASFFFSATPYPAPAVHRATVGLHDLGASVVGKGSVNLRAGYLLLLDFSRPGHRNLAPGPDAFSGLMVGRNQFNLDSASPGVQVYGRPGGGPLHYELAVVAGDPGESATFERDRWKDTFGRLAATMFPNTDHAVTIGAFGYSGRSRIETDLGDVGVAQRDDFWIVGPDLQADYGPMNLSAILTVGRHAHPNLAAGIVRYVSWRAEVAARLSTRWTGSVRFEGTRSADASGLDALQIAPHIAWGIAPNAQALLVWRQDLDDPSESNAVLAFDVVF